MLLFLFGTKQLKAQEIKSKLLMNNNPKTYVVRASIKINLAITFIQFVLIIICSQVQSVLITICTQTIWFCHNIIQQTKQFYSINRLVIELVISTFLIRIQLTLNGNQFHLFKK